MKYLYLLLFLGSTAAAQSLSQAVQMATVGTFDNLKTSRTKAPERLKAVEWAKGLSPLKAGYAKVVYMPDNRSQTWHLTLKNYTASVKDYLGDVKTLGNYNKQPLGVVMGGLFPQSLVLQSKNQLDVYSLGYVLYYEPELYRYYNNCTRFKKC